MGGDDGDELMSRRLHFFLTTTGVIKSLFLLVALGGANIFKDRFNFFKVRLLLCSINLFRTCLLIIRLLGKFNVIKKLYREFVK